MDDHQLEHRVALGAAGIGPLVLRREIEGDRPGQRHDHEGGARRRHPAEPTPPVEPAGQPPARQQGRAADQRRQHLDVEGDAQQRHRRDQRQAAAAQGDLAASSRKKTSQESVLLERSIATAIGVIASSRAAIRPAARPNGWRTRRYSSATEATPASACGRWIAQPLKPSTPGEGGLDPEGDRRLVERDEARRIEGIVEEQRAALQGAAHAGGVVFGAEAVGLQPPQAQHGGDHQHGAQTGGLEPLRCDSCRHPLPSSPAGLTHLSSLRSRGGARRGGGVMGHVRCSSSLRRRMTRHLPRCAQGVKHELPGLRRERAIIPSFRSAAGL